jgi:hypothetical protein
MIELIHFYLRLLLHLYDEMLHFKVFPLGGAGNHVNGRMDRFFKPSSNTQRFSKLQKKRISSSNLLLLLKNIHSSIILLVVPVIYLSYLVLEMTFENTKGRVFTSTYSDKDYQVTRDSKHP